MGVDFCRLDLPRGARRGRENGRDLCRESQFSPWAALRLSGRYESESWRTIPAMLRSEESRISEGDVAPLARDVPRACL